MRFRIILPLILFGFLPALGVARLMEQPLDWFFSTSGLLLGLGVVLSSYLLSRWLLKPVQAVMSATAGLLRGSPPEKTAAQWLPRDFWKLRCDINLLFAKHRQALNAAEAHASQSAQRLLSAERLVREAFTALQGIFAASDEGVAVVDGDGTIIASNKRLDEFLGQPVEALQDRQADTLLKAIQERFIDQQTVQRWLQNPAADPTFQAELEADVIGQEGHTFCLRTAPMQTDTGEIIGRLWMVRDCSQLRGLQRQLQESQKHGTIGQIAGGLAHDFDSMLTTIRGNLTLAEATPVVNDPEVRGRLQTANQATQRAADLVKQLLGYSRRSTGNGSREVTNLKALVGNVQNLLKHSVDPRIGIRLQLGHGPAFAMVDVTLLEQVLLNLALNARDALPLENGVIEIAVDTVAQNTVPAAVANANAAPAGGGDADTEFVMISVRDNGDGIPPELQQRVFEPFFTTKPGGTGTGLGLSTAQEIVRDHGGWIEFDSELGKGTEFRVYVPRVPELKEDQDEAGGAELVQVSKAGGSRRGTILVVDDEAPVRSIAMNMLSYLGYRTLEAGDGQQALDVIFNSGEKIDAMMLDIYMPRLSGRDTFQQLRAAGNDLPVVVCSGFVIDPDEFTILGEGRCPPVDIMLKPYSLDGLTKAMAKAVPGANGQGAGGLNRVSRQPVMAS